MFDFKLKAPIVLLLAIALLGAEAPIVAGETLETKTSNRDKKEVDLAFAKLIAFAPEYNIQPADSDDVFQLIEEPVLRWSNPLRATRDGGVLLWTHKGRPATVMCAYWTEGYKFDHEFQSLHELPIRAELNGDERWTPDQAGIEYQPLPDAPRVSKRRAVRLVQMRAMASKFKGSTGFVNKPKEPLRVLREPLYRYPVDIEAKGVIDGAMFALVQATDPEILVILEARHKEDDTDKTDNKNSVANNSVANNLGEAEWHVGFARMSVVSQFVKYRDRVFWSCQWGKDKDPQSTYFAWHFDEPEGLGKRQKQN